MQWIQILIILCMKIELMGTNWAKYEQIYHIFTQFVLIFCPLPCLKSYFPWYRISNTIYLNKNNVIEPYKAIQGHYLTSFKSCPFLIHVACFALAYTESINIKIIFVSLRREWKLVILKELIFFFKKVQQLIQFWNHRKILSNF